MEEKKTIPPYYANIICGYKNELRIYDLTFLVEVEPGSYFFKSRYPISDIPITYKLDRGTACTYFPFSYTIDPQILKPTLPKSPNQNHH